MEKAEVLEEFFKSLKTALNTSAIYFKEHQMFLTCVENLHHKLYDIFNFYNPFNIGITPQSLFIDGKYLEKNRLYVELAQFLHYRKVKNVFMEEGVTVQELIDFLSATSLPPKDIFKKGGLSVLLNTMAVSHISIEELDYSELLKGDSQVVKDIWIPLLEGALKENNESKINTFADNFDKIAANLNAKDFVDDQEVNINIGNLLNYLKRNSKDKFYKCSKRIVKSLLSDKSLVTEQVFTKLDSFIADLSEKEIADILYEELLTNEHFDALSFKLFAKLSGKREQRLIASSLTDKISTNTVNKQQLIKKLKELFFDPLEGIDEVYRYALSKFLEETTEEAGFKLEREVLDRSYHNLLINILAIEQEKELLEFISTKISQLLENTAMAKDTECIKNLLLVLEMRRKDNTFEQPLNVLEVSAGKAVEKAILEGEHSFYTEYFIKFLKKSSLELDFYINKIFVENKADQCILRLLFKFFPHKLDIFYVNIRKRAMDAEFLRNILESLKHTDSLLTLNILKYIFSFSDGLIKIEALKAMQTISYIDKEFIFNLINKGDIFSKKEALLVLEKDIAAKENALKTMLDIPNPFGLRNRLLLQNLRVIDELSPKEATPYLYVLSRKGFFSGPVKRYAQEILRRHGYGED